MPSSRKKPLARGGLRSAPNRATAASARQHKSAMQQAIPSHIVAPAAPDSHFATKHVDVERLRESTDLSAVMQITHDIKIGFNRFDMFTDRFEKQKQVVRNNNFKMICGQKYKSKKAMKAEKQESVTNHIKNKRIVAAMQRLREIGYDLSAECMGIEFIDDKILDRYTDRLKQQIKEEKEKSFGCFKQSNVNASKEKQAAAKAKLQAQQTVQPVFQQPTQVIQQPPVIEKAKLRKIDTMEQAKLEALANIRAEQKENFRIVNQLMDPDNNLDHMNKDEFVELLKNDAVFDDVANKVYNLHNERNKKLNLEYPLMVKLETNVQQVKQVLDGIDQLSFIALRDLKLTPSQLYSQKLQRSARIKYAVVDDIREILGNENLNRSRFCGIINRLINQKAGEMGKLKKGYEQYYLDEITNHADELPADTKCIKSLLSKENILRHQQDEIVAKNIVKSARAKQIGLKKSNSEERLLTQLESQRDMGNKYSLSRPRIKTLDEIQAEKALMLKQKQEKVARDRQTVLDNIYLLRLRQMYPNANIQCSEHIQNLIEAYLRRNMVQDEIQKEIAMEKLMQKKPRPFKLIRGLAVVRPGKFEYLDGDPLGTSRQKHRSTSTDNSSESEALISGKKILSGQLSVSSKSPKQQQYSLAKSVQNSGVKTHRPSQGYGYGGSLPPNDPQHRIRVASLDMSKVQVQRPCNDIKSAEADLGKVNSDDYQPQFYNITQQDKQRGDEISNDNETVMENKSALGKEDTMQKDLRSGSDVMHTAADFTTHHNDGIVSHQDQNWKGVTSSQTIKESYLASVENTTDVKHTNLDGNDENENTGYDENQVNRQVKMPISDDPSTYMQADVGRESPSFQMNLLNNLMNLGMFEQKSEDISNSDSKLRGGRMGNKTLQRKNAQHRSARGQLEYKKLGAYGIREPKFDLNQARREAEQRRGRTRQHLNISGLNSQDGGITKMARGGGVIDAQNLRFVSSARTIEFNQGSVAGLAGARAVDRSPSNEDEFKKMMYSGDTTAHSFLNSHEVKRKASVDQPNRNNLLQTTNQLNTTTGSRNTQKRFSQKPFDGATNGEQHNTLKSYQTEGTSIAELGNTMQFGNNQSANLKPHYANTVDRRADASLEALHQQPVSINLQQLQGGAKTAQEHRKMQQSFSASKQRTSGTAVGGVEHLYIAQPIQSYRVPISGSNAAAQPRNYHTTQATPVNASIGQQEAQEAEKMAATQRRFPMRETYTVHVKRKLDANPSLAAIASNLLPKTSHPQHLEQLQASTICGSRLGQYASGSQSRIQTAPDSHRQRRPVTGTVRGHSNQPTSQMFSKNPTSTQSTVQQRPTIIQRETILKQMQRLSSRAMASMPDVQWNKHTPKATAISTMTDQAEFCEVPQSQLPDRILSFMENNDLPVFIDKKKCNTIKFRTSRPEMKIYESMQRQSLVQQDAAFIRKQQQIEQANQENFKKASQFRTGKNVTLVLEQQASEQNNTTQQEGAGGGASAAAKDANFRQSDMLDQTAKLLNKAQNSRPQSSKPTTSGIAPPDIAKEANKTQMDNAQPGQLMSTSSRRRVIVKNNTQSMQDASTIERVTENKTAANATRVTNETPQIINIVNTGQPSILKQQSSQQQSHKPQKQQQPQVFNKDLGLDVVDSKPHGDKRVNSRSSAELGHFSEHNKTVDYNSIPLPRPLFQKSKTTVREGGVGNVGGGRSSAKGKSSSRDAAASKSKKNLKKANSNLPSRNHSTSQISQRNVQRGKAFTPSVIPDSAMQSPQPPDMLSADHPMNQYMASATYPISKTCSPDKEFD